MFDAVQIGWLDNDDYRRAAERAGVVELPDGMDDTAGPARMAGMAAPNGLAAPNGTDEPGHEPG